MKDTEMPEGAEEKRSAVEADRMARRLSNALQHHLAETYAPNQAKTLRSFSGKEFSELLGVSQDTLRKYHAEGKISGTEQVTGGRRLYTAKEMLKIRAEMETMARRPGTYLPGRRQGDKLQCLTVNNFKGGSGKSTTSVLMAQAFALRGYRVALVDLDPQATATNVFGINPEWDLTAEDDYTVYDALRYDSDISIAECFIETYFPNVFLCPAELKLLGYEHETARAVADGNTWQGRRVVQFFDRLRLQLKRLDDELPADERFDIVIIDTPPNLGFLTLTGLGASTSQIITTVPAMYDVTSMASFCSMLSELLEIVENDEHGLGFDFFRVLLTRHEPNDGPHERMVGFLRTVLGEGVLVPTILKSTAIADAAVAQETLFEVERKSVHRETYDRAMRSVLAVEEEIEKLVHEAWGRV